MKKDRDLYFENQGYFGNPMMGQPMYQTSQMYANNAVQVPYYNNINIPTPLPNYPNTPNFPNNDINSLEQRLNRMERQIRRLDSRISRIENRLNIDSIDYKTTADNYSINDTNMYMM